MVLTGAPASAYVVQCQDLTHDPTGRAITTRAWTATGGDVSPTSASDEAPVFVFQLLEDAEISLTVTNDAGESATVTRTPVGQEYQALTRQLAVAAGSTGWRVLVGLDGWRTWLAPGGTSCTAVPPICEGAPWWSFRPATGRCPQRWN
jgi:hypothetical protein